MLTSNFMEFLTLYGHFAGESYEEEEEEEEICDYYDEDAVDFDGETNNEGQTLGEESALLTPDRTKRKKARRAGNVGVAGTLATLLKSFVGTGVLFLPRAFLNGGMLFSFLVLLLIAALSYHCFVLLTTTRLVVKESFGGMGGVLYGSYFRNIINLSLVLSQIGFAAAYIVFTSENLQAFILAVSDCRTFIDIKYIILMQLLVFTPLSLYRNIGYLGRVALVADAFILLGLVYLYYNNTRVLVLHGVADITDFNKKDWTLFIGTAIFTFEGIGLLTPIQEAMKKPQKFPSVLGVVMVTITIVFISMGALSYAAYGSSTKTVIISNMPQGDRFVNGVQFIYSLAILLSTPCRSFP